MKISMWSVLITVLPSPRYLLGQENLVLWLLALKVKEEGGHQKISRTYLTDNLTLYIGSTTKETLISRNGLTTMLSQLSRKFAPQKNYQENTEEA